jgi:uncharacterized membrane protein
MIKQIALYTLIVGYLLAGINHFWHPRFYYKIIPPFVGDAYWVNIIAGVSEIILAAMVLYPQTRMVSAYLIIVMLLAFVPAHIYFFRVYPDQHALGWLRLLVVHPILIAWAWWVRY